MVIRCYDESTTQKKIISLESYSIKEIDIRYDCEREELKAYVFKGTIFDGDIKYRVIKEDVGVLVDLLERKRTCIGCENETRNVKELPCNLCVRHTLGDFYKERK